MYRRDSQNHGELHNQGVPEKQIWVRFLLRTLPAFDVLMLDLNCDQSTTQEDRDGETEFLDIVQSDFGRSGASIEGVKVYKLCCLQYCAVYSTFELAFSIILELCI